jgi:hypothetical protein
VVIEFAALLKYRVRDVTGDPYAEDSQFPLPEAGHCGGCSGKAERGAPLSVKATVARGLRARRFSACRVLEDVALRYRQKLFIVGHKVHDGFCGLAYGLLESIQLIVVGTLIGIGPHEVRSMRYEPDSM